MSSCASYLVDSLEEYQHGEMEEAEKLYLKDYLLDMSEILHKEGIQTGYNYDEMLILVKKDMPLPQRFQEYNFITAISETPVRIFIKEIKGLRRNKNDDLIVEVLAKKLRS